MQTGSPLLIRADLRGTLSFKKHIHYYNFVFKNKQTKKNPREFPSSPVDRTGRFHRAGPGTKILHASRCNSKKKKKKNPNYNNASKSNVTKSQPVEKHRVWLYLLGIRESQKVKYPWSCVSKFSRAMRRLLHLGTKGLETLLQSTYIIPNIYFICFPIIKNQ